MATTPVPTVTTDLLDYAPGSTAVLTASNFIIGSTLEFQVLHVTDPGSDGLYGTLDDVLGDNSGEGHEAWYVTDGVRTAGADGVVGTTDDEGDLDGVADGNIVTNWYVNPDDSLGATFLLTATAVDSGPDGEFGTGDDAATGQVASWSFTDGPTDPLDLTTANSSGELNGAFFSTAQFKGAPGQFNPFLQIQNSGGNEEGYNTEAGNNRPLDVQSSNALLLSGIPIARIQGVEFYEFRLDLQEPGSAPLISLDTLKIFQGSSDSLSQPNSGPGSGANQLEAFILSGGTLVYNMDADSSLVNEWVALNYDLVGSGTAEGDISVFVPKALFNPANGGFVYLYSALGYQGGDYTTAGGNEAWGIGPGTPIGASSIAGSKFEDFDFDGIKDLNELPLANVTIFLDDGDNTFEWLDGSGGGTVNGVWDPGEGDQWTKTDGSGNYVFANLAAGLGVDSTYHVREVVPTDYIQTGPLDGIYATGVTGETSSVSNFTITINLQSAGVTYNLPAFGNWSATPPEGALTLLKEVSVDGGNTWLPADTPLTGPTVSEGTSVQFRFLIESNDAQDYENLVLTDSVFSPLALASKTGGNNDDVLENNEIWTYTYGPVPAIVGQHTDTATLNADRVLPNGNAQDVTVANDANYLGLNATPTITIVKEVDANQDGTFNDISETVAEGSRLVDYKFTVTAGNNASTDVLTVTSFVDADLPGVTAAQLLAAFVAANGGSATLAPNASATFFINNVALELDDGELGEDPFVNTVTVNATDDEGTAASDSDDAAIEVNGATPTITIVKEVDANQDGTFNDISETVAEGSRLVDYKFTVTAGNNASTDVLTVTSFVDADLPGVTAAQLLAAFVAANGGSATLAPNASATFFINNVALELDDGELGEDPFVNTVTVNATDDEGTAASDSDDAAIEVNGATPTITIVKEVDANQDGTFNDISETVAEGSRLVDYKFTVTAGNNASTDVLTVTSFVDADLPGVTAAQLLAAFVAANGGSATLAPNASATFFINNVALELDDGELGEDPFVNTVTVNATDDEGTAASDSDDAAIEVNGATPTITIVKEVDANQDGTFNDISETVAEGSRLVDYKFTVTAGNNASTDVLTVTSFVDADLPGVTAAQLLAAFVAANGGSATLAPNASATFFINNVALELDDGELGEDPFVNTVTVNATDDEGTAASDSDDAAIEVNGATPTITIVKEVDANQDGTFNDISETVAEGSRLVDYKFTVTAGNNASTDVLTVTSFVDADLPGVTAAQLLAAFVAANGGSATLAPNASATFFINNVALELDDGELGEDPFVNTVTVNATDDEGTAASDSDDAAIEVNGATPTITIVKEVDANQDGTFNDISETVAEGSRLVDYKFTVTAGNNASTDVLTVTSFVDADLPGVTAAQLLAAFVAANGGSATLAPNASATFFINNVALELDDGELGEDPFVNTVTVNATDDEGTAASDSDDAAIEVNGATPTITIVKEVDANQDGTFNDISETVAEGSRLVDYKFTVTAGNNASTDVLTVTSFVDADLPGVTAAQLLAAFVAANGGSATLAPNASATFFINNVALELDDGELGEDPFVNTVTVNATDDEGTAASDSDDAAIEVNGATPTITIVKEVDANQDGTFNDISETVAEGSRLVDYKFTVTAGNNASTDVLTVTSFVDADLPGVTAAQLLAAFVAANGGSATLAPNASATFFINNVALELDDGELGEDPFVNTVTVNATDDEGTAASDSDDAAIEVNGATPTITIVKEVDANQDGTFNDISETVAEGSRLVDYKFTVTAGNNASTDVLTVTSFVDADLPGVTAAQLLAAFVAANGGSATLAPNASATFFINNVALELDDGELGEDPFVNTVTVNATDDEGTAASDSDDAAIEVNGATPTITIVKEVDANQDGTFNDISETVAEGSRLVDYKFTVTAGNNASTDVLTVTSFVDADLPGVTAAQLLAAFVAANGGSATLAPNASATFFINNVALELDDGELGEDPFVNTVTVNATDDEGTAASDSDDAAIEVNGATPTITIVKEVDANQDGTFNDISETVAEGSRLVDYKFTVTAGNNASTDVLTVTSFVDADLPGVTAAQLLAAFVAANGGSATLAPNASATFFINNVALELDDGELGEDPFVNTVTVNATDDEGTAASDSDDAAIEVNGATPTITIVKEVDANQDGTFNDISETVAEGSRLVDYKFTVTAGNNASTDVLTVTSFVDADLPGVTAAQLLAAFVAANGGSATLAPNASATFFINNVALELDDGELGEDPFVNTVTVNATDDEGTAASDSDDAAIEVNGATPTITIVKEVDANQDGTFNDISETVAEGSRLVDYKFTVTAGNNASTDVLTVTSFVDADLPGVTAAQLLAAFVAANGGSATLAPNASATFFINNVALELDDGELGEDPFVNTVTVNATDDEGTAASDSDDAAIEVNGATPTITIEKTVDADGDGNFADFELLGVGDDLADYRYVLTNTSPAGAVDPLTIDSLVDDRGTPLNTSDDIELVVGGVLQGNVTLDKGLIDDLDNFLDVGETWTYTVEDVDLSSLGFGDTLTNTATVQATDDDGSEATANDDATVERPVPPTFDVIGYKWNDLDHNGEWDDPAEQGLSGWKIFVDADGSGVVGKLDWTDDGLLNGVWDPGEGEQWTTTDGFGSYNLTLDTAGMAAGSYHVREVSQPGWIQSSNGSVEINIIGGGTFNLEFPDGVPLDPSTSGEFGNDGAYNFGNYSTPGVRTPGFWTNTKWQQYWNGNPTDQDSLPQTGQPNFPDGELLYAVDDPVEADLLPDDGPGLLIGDYNKNGLTDIGEETLFYTRAEALAIINSSTQTANQDARYILDRDVIATWLNFLNGNPIEEGTDTNLSDPPAVGSPQYYLDQAIDWLQYVTPNEGGVDNQGDGKLAGTTRVPSSSTFWNQGISNNSDGNPLNNYPGGGYNNPFDGPVLAGNNIHNALNEYNSSGTINGVFYAWDGDSVF